MREIVRVEDASALTLSNRLVAERIQLLPAGEASVQKARLANERGST